MHRWQHRLVTAIALALVLTGLPILSASAIAPQTSAFQRTWERTDLDPLVRPYATWIWGESGFTSTMLEEYEEAPDGFRTVQYFDKSRMEDNSYRAPDAPWDVSNGLLVKELITGRMQFGDNSFDDVESALVNVAGDGDDANGPTYATFATLLNSPPLDAGTTIIQRLSRDGAVTNDPSLAQYGATATELLDVPGIRHRVASPFWTFMTSIGPVYDNGNFVTAPLFENAYYATGFPISEAYWANVKVANIQRDVLIQCFERRCLTYTPGNDPAWQVEMGNVGQHYYTWRYLTDIPKPPPSLDGANYAWLGPAPLVVWPFGGLEDEAYILLGNDTPYDMRVSFDGPTSYVMDIEANPAGIIYPNDDAYPGCSEDGPVGVAFLPQGNYRVSVEFFDGGVPALGGYWTIVPDAAYFSCFYITNQSSPSTLAEVTNAVEHTRPNAGIE